MYKRLTWILVVCVLSLATPNKAQASLITYQFDATITSISVNLDCCGGRGLAQAALLPPLGAFVGASAFGTFTFNEDAVPDVSDPSMFWSSRGEVGGMTFGTDQGLSIRYNFPNTIVGLSADPTVWRFDFATSPSASNAGGFEYTFLYLLSNGGSLATDEPILTAFDPLILDHGMIHFGASYANPLEIQARIGNIRLVPEPATWMLLGLGMFAGLLSRSRRSTLR